MHELSIAMEIVKMAENESRKAGSSKITEVHLEIGELAGVDLEALLFSLEMARQRSMLKEAFIKVDKIQGRAICLKCKSEFDTVDLHPACPECNDRSSQLIAGTELRIIDLLVE